MVAAFDQAFAMLKEFDFRTREQMVRDRQRGFLPRTLMADFSTKPIEYEKQRPFKPNRKLLDGTPVGYVKSGTQEQRDLYPEIWDFMPEGRRPRVPHYRIGTSRPRPIRQDKGGDDQWASVNLPSTGKMFNYEYSDESIVNDENIKYIMDMLNHEWGHALIDDDLHDEGRRGELEHEFGAYVMQGLDSDEIQEQLRSRGIIE